MTPELLLSGPAGLDSPRGSALASWTPLWAFLAVFAAGVLLICTLGARRGGPDAARTRLGSMLWRLPRGLEAVSGVEAWAATTLLFSIYGLAVAGYGFYTDVAWHVALGRDDDLFTAPHTAILVGLVMIAIAPAAGVAAATVSGYERGARWGYLRIPWSLIPLGVLGTAALIGFPIDELWHRAYGVDVTMWSPPHLIMILAASFSGLASWLVLADAGVRPADGAWGRGLHVVTAALTLQGLSSVQGEFSFGVPQWQQLYHPVLVALAAGFALVLIRMVHGSWWALGIAGAIFAFQFVDLPDEGSPVQTRPGAVYLGSALAIELVARIWGTERRLRFALLCGTGIATIGFGVEWAWNQGAHQPWTTALLPEAALVGAAAALCAALLGAATAGAISGRAGTRIPAAVLVVAALGVIVSLAIPAPRRVGDVRADVRLEWVDEQRAIIRVGLDPPDAARNARWFTAGSWQWGGRRIAHMREIDRGTYEAEEPLFLAGRAKSLVRLHRGAEMMAIAVRLPADPEYGLAEVGAEDRSGPFVGEQRYLQREADEPAGAFAVLVYGLAVGLALAWALSFTFAAGRIAGARSGAPARF